MEGEKRSEGAVRSQRGGKPEPQQSAPGFSVTKPGARDRQPVVPVQESRAPLYTMLIIFGVLTLGLALTVQALLGG